MGWEWTWYWEIFGKALLTWFAGTCRVQLGINEMMILRYISFLEI